MSSQLIASYNSPGSQEPVREGVRAAVTVEVKDLPRASGRELCLGR